MGIGPLAQIAHDAGYEVAGSDLEDSLMTKRLQDQKIPLSIGAQDGKFLQERFNQDKIDWFVYTAATPDDNLELILARSLGIRTSKRDEFLAYFIKDKDLKMLAVSGTHGKTTTTGMLVWALQQLGVPVSYSVGTTISFGSSGHYDSSSKYFVYECDEFDRNMLHFNPFLSLITSLDYDHPDTYPTEKDYLDAFRQLATQSDKVLTWAGQRGEIYSELSNVTLLDDNSFNQDIKLAGLHNRYNASLVQEGLKVLGITEDSTKILSGFPGTDRRFEKLANNLYSDYGHHPAEIAATLQMAREISDHVVLVYQPHQNIRQHNIKDAYTDQFELAEEIYWLPTYLSREDPNLPILKPEDLIQSITNKDSVHTAEFNDELWSVIQAAKSEGKLVLCMGAGTIDGWVRKQLAL